MPTVYWYVSALGRTCTIAPANNLAAGRVHPRRRPTHRCSQESNPRPPPSGNTVVVWPSLGKKSYLFDPTWPAYYSLVSISIDFSVACRADVLPSLHPADCLAPCDRHCCCIYKHDTTCHLNVKPQNEYCARLRTFGAQKGPKPCSAPGLVCPWPYAGATEREIY